MVGKVIIGLFIGFVFFISFSCKSIDGGGLAGPCVHTYEEPSLNIDWVKDGKTENYLNVIRIKEVVYNDSIKLNLSYLKIISKNVVYADSMLICNLPCGFGTYEGSYNIKVSANGFRDTIIQATPKYKIYKGGCPSSNSGGARITFQMTPNN
jgi:hypothetical protein